MTNLIKKYRPDYSNSEDILPDHCNVSEAVLMLMGIDSKSELGMLLRVNNKECDPDLGLYLKDGHGIKWPEYENPRELFGSEPTLRKENNGEETLKVLLIKYREISEAILKSSLVWELPNSDKFEKNGGLSENIRVNVKKLLEWADLKGIPVDEYLMAAYSIEQKTDIRTEKANRNTIAILLKFIKGEIEGIEKHPSYQGITQFIDTLDYKYSSYYGISASTLEKKFRLVLKEFDGQLDEL